MSQISIFDGRQPLKITKPIRLIECFAGYGSQALALKYLGVDFEHWKIAEWAVKSIQAYKDMHFADDNTDYSAEYSKEWLIDYLFAKGISADYNKPMTREQIARMGEEKIRTVYNNIIATNNLVSVTNVKGADLDIKDTDKYTYILTYSFPCQDLSNAGLSKGMAKGSGTRSGLLWEIERILDECDELPQVLLMENVPQVIGEKNKEPFRDWFLKLESLGYKSYYQIMNGKDYEIPQNRERCFMVSFFGDYFYDFPYKKPLKLKLKDLLEAEVNEKYYLSDKQVEMFVSHTERKQQEGCGFKFQPTDGNGIGKCVTTRAGSRCDDNFVSVQCEQVGELKGNGIYEMNGRVYSPNGLNPTVRTFCGGGQEIKILEDYFIKVKSANKDGYEIAREGDAINISMPNSDTRRGRVGHQCSQTLMTEPNMCVVEALTVFDFYNKTRNNGLVYGTITTNQSIGSCGVFAIQKAKERIRKLTPKECFRLMGVKDEDFYRVARNQSDSSLYHLAGDSIITNCLMAIFKEML